jgi:hypothetical protein
MHGSRMNLRHACHINEHQAKDSNKNLVAYRLHDEGRLTTLSHND